MWRKWAVIVGMACFLVISITIGNKDTTTNTKEQHIQQLLQKELYYDALLVYEQLYKETGNSKYLYEQGVMLLHLKNEEQAIQTFEKVKQIEPKDRKVYNQLLTLYDKESDEYVQLLYDMSLYFKEDNPVKAIENTVSPLYFNYGNWVSSYRNNVVIENNKKYGIVTVEGETLVEPIFEWIGLYDEQIGFYPARFNGRVQYIDLLGYKRIHIDGHIEEIGVTSQHKRWVKLKDKVIYVDDTFQTVLDNQFEDGGSFYNGVAAVKKEGKWGIIDENGKTIIPFQYDDILFDDYKYVNKYHVIWVKQKDSWQLLNEQGQVLSKEYIKKATPFLSDEPAGVQLNDGWNFITKRGEILSKNRYLEATAFRFGHAFVKTEDKQWHIINQQEEQGDSIIADTIKPFNQLKITMYVLNNDVGYVKLFDRGKYNGVHR